MKYTVYYKKFIFWKKIKNVIGDTIIEHQGKALPVRVLFLENKERIEIPMSYIIKFSKERFYDIQEKMEKESGLKIPVRD